MRRIAERLLQERGDEPLSSLSGQSIGHESGLGKENQLRGWMRRASASSLSDSDERPLMPIRLMSERLSMPFRIIINAPEGIMVDRATPSSHLLSMLRLVKDHPTGLNSLSTALDAANAVLEVWKEEKGTGWAIGPNGMARPVEEQLDCRCISVGKFHRTSLWPVVCGIISEALSSGLFSMDMIDYAQSEQQAILDGEWEENGADAYAEARLSIIKKESWNKPWWDKAISQLWKTLVPLDMKKLRRRIDHDLLNDAALIIEAIHEYDQECKDSWVEAEEKKMSEILEDASFAHESAGSQIIWGVNDEYLIDALDGYIESKLSKYAIYNWIEVTKINDLVTQAYTNEHLYRSRVALRSQINQWFDAAEKTLKAR